MAVEIPDGDALKEWIQIAKVGKNWDARWETPVDLSLELFKAVVAQFKRDRILLVFDINHASVWMNEAPAQAWGDDLKIEGNALYAHIKEWTDAGAANVRGRYYRYVSPTFVWSMPDRKSGTRGPSLHSVALTNTPVIVDIEPLTLAAKPGAEPTPQGGIMKELREWLVGRGVTLAADADDTAILAALSAYEDGLKKAVPAALAKALGHADDKTPMSVEAATAALTAMQTAVPAPLAQALGHPASAGPLSVASAQSAIMTLQKGAGDAATVAAERVELATLRAAAFTDRLDKAVGKGLATPNQKTVLLSQFGVEATRPIAESTLATLEAGVPTGPLSTRLKDPANPDAPVNDTDRAVALQLGIKPEDMKETKNG